MNKAILFDLDMTLVDTSSLLGLRKNRKWSQVYRNIPGTTVFPGVTLLINKLESDGVKMGIVTNSPAKYARNVVSYHGINLEVLTGYHDTENHKPSPDPIIHGIRKLNLSQSDDFIAYVGDERGDITAANNARGVVSIGVSWGLCTAAELNRAGSKLTVSSFDEIYKFSLSWGS